LLYFDKLSVCVFRAPLRVATYSGVRLIDSFLVSFGR
jgi:hypothetical protein